MQETNNSKKTFSTGLMTGIAVVAVIGFLVMAGLYWQGKNPSNTANLSDQIDNDQEQDINQPAPTPSKTEIAITDSDHIRGNKNASVNIIEFSDFQCPYCSVFHETMKLVRENYPNDVKWVYKHFPLDSIHPYARPAAEASECVAEQKGNDGFWQFADGLFENQSRLGESLYQELAGNLGLNLDQFNNCLSSRKYKGKVEEDYQEGIRTGVRGTPGNFINGQSTPGALPYEQMENIIDNLL